MKACAFLLLLIGAFCAMSPSHETAPHKTAAFIEALNALTDIPLDEKQAIINWVDGKKPNDDPEQLRIAFITMCKVIVANKEAIEKATVADDLIDIGDDSAKDKKIKAIWKDFEEADTLGKITRIRRNCNIELH